LSSAATPDSILGTWKLQSWVREIIASGKREDFFGAKPDGYLSYSPDARMQAILIADNRIKPNSVAPADEDKLKLYNTMLSYGGTYKIEGDKVVHSVDISWNQAWTGTEVVRFYKIEGDTLTITALNQANGVTSQATRQVLIFKKVR
jgi:Lipocalin-like domain